MSSLMTKLRKDEDEKNKKQSVEECTRVFIFQGLFQFWRLFEKKKNAKIAKK